jgi:acyl CoA:acetate/3-ketoacid CoA transferase beta subunit
MTAHTKRQFVEKVDHVSGAGRPVNNVVKVVSPLGVFDFDEDNRMRISTLHPGIKAQDVIKNTGFPIGEKKEYPLTGLPSDTELATIEELDPDGRIRGLI